MAVSQQGASLATLLVQVALGEMVGIMLAHACYIYSYIYICKCIHTYIYIIHNYIHTIICLDESNSILMIHSLNLVFKAR